MQNQNLPLEGLKVVEIGVAMAGPFCAMLLADYGAEVSKIERIGEGDDSRHWPPYFNDELGYYFAAVNRNKRSIALDLKHPEGVAAARRMIAEADIVIDNYRIGALERAGLGYTELSAINPRLIYCSISGFGASGPRREERANDIFMQAFSGGMSITGEPDRGPSKMGLSVADVGAGMFAALGIMMAVEMRHRTGRGQMVNTSLLEGQVAMLSYHLTSYFASGRTPLRRGGSGQVNVPYQAFKAADDWLVIAAFNERMWQGTCVALGHPEWADDPRFRTADERIVNRTQLVGMISVVLATRPSAEWQRLLVEQGVPCSPVNTIDQVVADEQVAAREMVVSMDVPGVGAVRMAGLPIKFSDAGGRLDLPPPRLGEHTGEILAALGYTPEQIDRLAETGAVGDATERLPAPQRSRA